MDYSKLTKAELIEKLEAADVAKGQYLEKLNAADHKIQDLTNKANTLEMMNKHLGEVNEMLVGKATNQDTEIKNLNRALAAQKKAYKILEGQNSSLNVSIRNTNEKNSELLMESTKLKAKIRGLNENNAELYQKFADESNCAIRIKAMYSELCIKYSFIYSALVMHGSTINKINGAIETIEALDERRCCDYRDVLEDVEDILEDFDILLQRDFKQLLTNGAYYTPDKTDDMKQIANSIYGEVRYDYRTDFKKIADELKIEQSTIRPSKTAAEAMKQITNSIYEVVDALISAQADPGDKAVTELIAAFKVLAANSKRAHYIFERRNHDD